MKRKIAYFLVLLPIFFLILSACKSKSEGFLTILNSQNQQIYQTRNTKTLDEFADILDLVESEEDNEDTWVDLPDDAEVNYIYDISGRKGGSGVKFTTYKNYPYVTISNIPAVSDITLRLSEKDVNKLNHPDEWVK